MCGGACELRTLGGCDVIVQVKVKHNGYNGGKRERENARETNREDTKKISW